MKRNVGLPKSETLYFEHKTLQNKLILPEWQCLPKSKKCLILNS